MIEVNGVRYLGYLTLRKPKGMAHEVFMYCLERKGTTFRQFQSKDKDEVLKRIEGLQDEFPDCFRYCELCGKKFMTFAKKNVRLCSPECRMHRDEVQRKKYNYDTTKHTKFNP